MNTQRMAKLQTTGLYVLIFVFSLLWLTACSDRGPPPVAEASVKPRISTAFEGPCDRA